MRIVNLPANFVKFSIRSKQSLLLAVAVVSVMALLLAVPIFVARRSSAHAVNSAETKQQGCCADQPAIPRRMIGTYYTTENNFKSTLILNNKGPNQIVVTPILHGQNGQTFTASPVAVGGQSSQEVDLNVQASIAGQQFRSGSFEFTYEGGLLEMGGGLRIVDSAKSLIFDEQMLEPGMKFSSPQLESVFSIPFESAKVNIILTNTTAKLLAVDGQASFAGLPVKVPIPFVLGPRQSRAFTLPQGLTKRATAGAISLRHNGEKGALLAMIHLQDSDRGYSEAVNFTNPGAKTTERHGAGLRLGSVNNDPLKPVIAVRNIGDSATTVTATVPYLKQNGDTGTIALPQVSLAPGEIKLLNTSNPQLRRNDFATAGLEIKYTGAPGSVIASASSVSQSGDHVFALPMKDPQGGLSSTGGYPWFINETSSTVVYIKNTTDAPQQFHLGIIYPGGAWGSNLKTLAPGQTFELDVRKVRDSQVKGSEGNTMPSDVTAGHISWGVYGPVEKALIGRAQTIDLARGQSSTYECQCYCGISFGEARLLPGSVSGFPGATVQFQAEERDQDCFGNFTPWFGVNPQYQSGGFSTQNSNVATITSDGLGTAVGVGTTDINATWTSYRRFRSGPIGCAIVAVAALCKAFCDVQPPNFTIAHNKSATGLRPTGIIAGINGADPSITAEETQATVTVSTNPPTSGLNVTLSVVAETEGFLTVGWHIDHTGVRPPGTLSRTSGTTDQNGVFTAVYTAPQFSGNHKFMATMNGVTKEVGIGVFINGLQGLLAGSNYTLVGETATHPLNHSGTAIAVANLPLIANDYKTMFPGAANLRYNDMSLPSGGRFDIDGNWVDTSHAEHRVGRNCDISSSNVPTNRWAALNQIFLDNDVRSINNETACCTHWHVRF